MSKPVINRSFSSMMDTTNTNYNGGATSASMYTYGRASDDEKDKKEVAIALPIMIVVLLLLRLLCFCRKKDDSDQEEQDRVHRRQQQQSIEAFAAAGDVEAAAVAAEPPLVCTYRKEDGWREGSCGVCLAELDDGEAVRVLPACMHYFHAACVGEWLRTNGTCPLCRSPLVAPATAD